MWTWFSLCCTYRLDHAYCRVNHTKRIEVLAPYATHLQGMDISPKMVDAFNNRFSNALPLPGTTINAVVGNLIAPTPPSSEISTSDFYNFDLAVVGYGFHHFEDPPLSVKRLAERVKPGKGIVMIIDFLPFTEHVKEDQKALHTISHQGFKEEDLKKMFEDAGLVFDITLLDEKIKFGKGDNFTYREVFFAKGTRKA